VRRGGLHALGLAAIALGGVESAVLVAAPRRSPLSGLLLWLSLVAAWSFIGSGLVARMRRPENPTGLLMMLVGVVLLAGLLNGAEAPALHTLGAWMRPLHWVVFVYLLLAFPTGRLQSHLARVIVVATFIDLAILSHAPLVIGEDGLGGALEDASWAIGAVIFLAASAVLIQRWSAGTTAWRRTVAPVLWPGALTLAALSYFNVSSYLSRSVGLVPQWAFRIAFVGMPFAFLAVLLRLRLARASVAELVVELDETRATGVLRDALARALGDPSLAVAYWLPDEQRHVDLDGRPVQLPGPGEARMTTVVQRDGRRIAALIHDQALREDPELTRAVSAAAALALDNERLQAELRAHLDELKASRARIVNAADLERRRIQRDLHDGTQQRLTSIAMAIALAESKLSSDPGAALASLHQAKEVLAAALTELRDLSQGIHPGFLTERGLGPALQDLAYTAPLPVTVAADLNGRMPDQVEAAAYYVVAEGLANVAKHAHASTAEVTLVRNIDRLIVRVRDDGIGGADPNRGTGLRGLTDRVQALGGRLRFESSAGQGTEIRATIPCG
jgi:signal transduction histidine kinase